MSKLLLNLKIIHKLTKMPLVYFVILSGVAGFGLGLPHQHGPISFQLAEVLFGLMFLSMGSFSLNQIQEYKMDQKMPRTEKRPLASGQITWHKAMSFSLLFLFLGFGFLFLASKEAMWIGGVTVLFYNGIYTYLLKPHWAFAAIPGAIPGALPAVTAFVGAGGEIFTPECFYLFTVIFLWQMPHYWSLAIKYKEDYKKADVPVLPVKYGNKITLYYMLKYYLVYLLVALLAPYFIHTGVFFWGLIFPVIITVSFYFYKFYQNQENWKPYFHWINHSLLVFIATPVLDKWILF